MQYLELPRHVMRFGRHGTQRRPPQNVLPARNLHQINQIRMPIGELFNPDARGGSVDSAAQVLRKRRHIQFFALPDKRCIGVHLRNVAHRQWLKEKAGLHREMQTGQIENKRQTY